MCVLWSERTKCVGQMMSVSLILANFLSFLVVVLGADSFTRYDFPPSFIFGSGTSAYQVEGAANEDGRTPSIWDTFVHAGYSGGANGDIACDQYHKYKEDVKLMAGMGLDAYRFSISWSRLIPNGRGPVNPKGLAYYNDLINELISHGIQPHVTLTNYDLPQALEDEYSGWLSRKIVDDFTNYADVCFKEFGDRVPYWITVNEPNVFALGSYDQGFTPPMHCSPPFGFVNCSTGNSSTEPFIVVHNILLAHASTARLYKSKYQEMQQGNVGISVYTLGFVPLTSTSKDVAAAKRAYDFYIGWVVDPLVFGDYPEAMKRNVGAALPAFTTEETNLVKDSIDFLGVIHYTTLNVQDNTCGKIEQEFSREVQVRMRPVAGSDMTSDELPVIPWGLESVLEYLKHAYGNLTIHVVENGQKTKRNSTLDDTSRVKYIGAYIGSVLDAVRNGSNTRAYFAWSFLDVLELLDGLRSGYGFYYVDLNDPDLKRQPKLSAHWFSHFLMGERVNSDGSGTPHSSSGKLVPYVNHELNRQNVDSTEHENSYLAYGHIGFHETKDYTT